MPIPCYFNVGTTENDVAILEWSDFSATDLKAAQACSEWIVAQITLQPGSNVLVGTMRPDGRMTFTLTVAGTCRILDPLGSKPDKMQFDFSFDGYVGFGNAAFRGPPPFRLSDGPAILRWDPQRTDKAMFPEGYRLPDPSWAPKVAARNTSSRSSV